MHTYHEVCDKKNDPSSSLVAMEKFYDYKTGQVTFSRMRSDFGSPFEFSMLLFWCPVNWSRSIRRQTNGRDQLFAHQIDTHGNWSHISIGHASTGCPSIGRVTSGLFFEVLYLCLRLFYLFIFIYYMQLMNCLT